MKPYLRVVQVSDCHLFKNPNTSLLGVNTDTSLQAVLQHIQANKKGVDLLLLTGDISQDGSRESYERIATYILELALPVAWVAGNHDDEKLLNAVFSASGLVKQSQIKLDAWQLILLSSVQPAAVAGFFSPETLNLLEKALAQHPQSYQAIVFHHQPLLASAKWMQRLGLINSEAFWDIIAKHHTQYPHTVKSVIFGHVHQIIETEISGVACYSAPSTCFQFKPDSVNFQLDNLPQGYRWYHCYPSGKIETGVIRLLQYVGEFWADAKGY